MLRVNGQLPRSWQLRRLGDVAEFLDNLRVPLKESDRDLRPGPYPYYGANGQVGTIDDFIFDEPLILLAEDGGNFGSEKKPIAYKITGKTWVNNHAHVLRPRNGCDVDYLHRVLSYYDVAQFVTGTTRLKLTKGDSEKIQIPIPPLPIQKQIAAILEKADAAREKRRQTNQLTERFLQSAFLEMFGDPVTNPRGWDVRTLEEVSTEIVDCPHSTPIHSDSITEYPCIRTTELRGGYIDWSAMKYVSMETYQERTRRLVPMEGDIVYGREGSFGEAVRVPKNVQMCLGQRTMLFRPNSTICTSEYLWAAIRSEDVFRQALRITTGSTVGHLNVKDVKRFRVLVPLLSVQQKFAALVEKVEGLRVKQRESERELENLFQSLMQKVFKGELVG